MTTVLDFGKPVVVLAPMAGITNLAYRRLCRETSSTRNPSGIPALFVSEMITSRALIERDAETLRMTTFGVEESPRSLQLYGVDPDVVSKAVAMIVEEDRADHIDLNMGCPVPKVTRKGGGAALPWKHQHFKNILKAAVDASQGKPISVKMRMGIDDDHITYLKAGEIAEEIGIAWVGLHARTALQLYSGQARWQAIKMLKSHISIPVLGNGDIWSGNDAKRMFEETGCDGVIVGRGCLGKPWLFADIEFALRGVEIPTQPDFREVADMMIRHAELLADYLNDEAVASREFRKHVAWYTKGFRVGGETRHRLAMIDSIKELRELLATIEDQPYPQSVLDEPRGRSSSAKSVALPEGWLDSDELSDLSELSKAELSVSGG
ncbi:MAG: hypothetical protein RIS09_573 [Actinomycetota bacterium]|jgi:nifR3 family TIM-barrel protein